MNLNNTYDYAVIGAGIVGLSTALQLQKQNVSVVVLEKEKEPGLHQSGRIQESFIQESTISQIQVSLNFL